jgi:general secretion pathway protein I
MPVKHSRAFTLIEVLVALAVLAIALTAVMRALAQNVDLTGALRDRTTALWVAQNRLAQHQIQRDWPAPDTTEGTTAMAGREWLWHEQVSSTPDAALRRIEIDVRTDAKSGIFARLTGFLSRPAGTP